MPGVGQYREKQLQEFGNSGFRIRCDLENLSTDTFGDCSQFNRVDQIIHINEVPSLRAIPKNLQGFARQRLADEFRHHAVLVPEKGP